MAEAADNHGTPRSPARRGRRLPRGRRQGLALLALLPVLAGVLQLPGAAPAQAAPSGSKTVEVSVNSVSPAVPAADDTVTITGQLTNKGKQKVSDARVALRMTGRPLDSRAEITSGAHRTGFNWAQDGNELVGDAGQKDIKGGLAPGVAVPFTVSVPAEDLATDGSGVYQVSVAVSGTTPATPWDTVLGIEHTFLPWQTSERDTRTGLTYLWPLISTPQLTARTDPDEVQTPYFISDALERELRPGGRLQVLLDEGKDLPVTWVIDPDLLASVHAMTSKHWVLTEGGKKRVAASEETQQIARAWLDELQSAVQGREVVALPYGDTDLASVAHRAEGSSTVAKQLSEAVELSQMTVESVLEVPARTDVAWPVQGALDPSIVNVADRAGADKIIARSDSFKESSGLTYTPTAVRSIGQDRTAIVTDAALSRGFEGDMVSAESSALAVQEFLAQTLMITLQAPNRQRSVVVAPQRTPSAAQAQTMATALRGLSNQYWVTSQDLAGALEAKPDPRARRTVPSAGSYPRKLRAQELRPETFVGIRDTQQDLENFRVILTEPVRVIAPIGNAIKRELSNQWRGDPDGARAYRDDVRHELSQLTGSVTLIDKSDLTLSGRTGVIPVTVQNNLVQDVKGLKVRLTSSNERRLKISEDQVVSVPGGHSTSVKFETTANASDNFTITAQLYTADDRAFGEEKRFKVEVTSITSTVLLVIGVGILLIVLAGVRMYTQRKRAAAAAETDDGDDGDNSGDDGDAGVNDPEAGSSDDTGPADEARTETGEKVDR
ncbi:hypothetical protein SRB5_27940 [Streptomyces sp. RB5]|uniref:Uncharacterized protein n=1 Tax=Streptomyces smaragdinus TaxID=2585196 RepID=A0A7K0CGT5_9ACTN|nr:DUF6049 family protein [Streptomyces smaragdinus]MQY12658.1 hypothetical protein [Streptomyces smaragdinus]